jgi:hypothetical protein
MDRFAIAIHQIDTLEGFTHETGSSSSISAAL